MSLLDFVILYQGFSRHRNEAAKALQCKFRLQDDGISMVLSKQSALTKVGLSASEERERQKNCCAAGGP